MIGISTMSGCPVKCKFCATANMKKCRNLTAQEMMDQVDFVLKNNPTINPEEVYEFKINLTRMGEPFLNVSNVKTFCEIMTVRFPKVHLFVSTIGIKNSDFSWIKENVTLQFSVHALNEDKRNWLIPYRKKMSIHEIGNVRTSSALKTTINMTLVDCEDFDIEVLKKHFSQDSFFIKLSPINKNEAADRNGIQEGVIQAQNLF